MLVPVVGVVQQHLKSWALGPVLQCLERFLEETAFRSTLIKKPNAFTRPQGLYSLPVTLKTFLIQCLAQDHSCRTAVATAKDHGWLPPSASPDTAAYCRARDALAGGGLQKAVEHTAQALDAGGSDEHLWMGRQVHVALGTGIALPDTEANQDDYRQPAQQKLGCGFPVLRLVAFMSLATGAVSRYSLGNLHDHEQRLFQELRTHLKANDIVLGDRNFGTFANLVLLKRQGADGVFRRHQSRGAGVDTVKRLGQDDSLVRWRAPHPYRPPWLDASVDLPETMVVREVSFQVTQPGLRTQSVTLVTTLLDAKTYPAWALAELYLKRWCMELWLRDIKITMDMEMLRTKTPARVRAELAMFLVGYNLIRTVMLDASKVSQARLERLSFKSALMRFGLWCARLGHGIQLVAWLRGYSGMLSDLSRDLNPNRPGRYEPRVVKRRPKKFPRMQQPRQVLREKALT
ncbi:MAG TPA: IS4 family transposase, partial [Gammaproteobacteria bacterium]|nr:IS4 family transposase [Gammaproteobacteria bacterium]